ncbi:uncharacterized protein LOC126911142 [Spodoptera frugiperda]|uniref:Uncharacterized protein LOC126911142 n=1 Tax=Spodoptera frugiperda TaxID=7108 RepID=A0A9R0DS49_SPOFR|nr:uncharacterized protein LOC126911142 [Spodoptera frugiperda]
MFTSMKVLLQRSLVLITKIQGQNIVRQKLIRIVLALTNLEDVLQEGLQSSRLQEDRITGKPKKRIRKTENWARNVKKSKRNKGEEYFNYKGVTVPAKTPKVNILKLSKNMRAHLGGDESAGRFSDLLLKIGNGDFPSFDGMLTIPEELCTVVTTVQELLSKVYPDIIHIHDKPIEWLCERAILTPKNDQAAAINDILLMSFEGEEKVYTSIDTVVNTDDATNYPVEFLNSLKPPGLPYHKLILRVGTPIMLLRNLKPPKLCNGTRLQVKALHRNIVEATILTGCATGETVFIPRIPLIPNDIPFEFKRLQFPLKVCFAMTINKSQGQTLKFAGIDLREHCFSHGHKVLALLITTPKVILVGHIILTLHQQ